MQCSHRKKLNNSSFKAVSTLALLFSLELTNGFNAFHELSTGVNFILFFKGADLEQQLSAYQISDLLHASQHVF